MDTDSQISLNFRMNMAAVRQDKGLSQGELAARMSKGSSLAHQTTIARIEGGKRAVKLDEAHEIAGALGVQVSTLIETNTLGALTYEQLMANYVACRFASRALVESADEFRQAQGNLRNAIKLARDHLEDPAPDSSPGFLTYLEIAVEGAEKEFGDVTIERLIELHDRLDK